VASGSDDEEDDARLEDDDPGEENADEEPFLDWTIGGLTASGNDHHSLHCEDDIVPPAVSETPAWILRGQCRG
jgi:hypothetical protein